MVRRATAGAHPAWHDGGVNAFRITSVEQLAELYGQPSQGALLKETPRLTAEYRALIESAPFVALATSGPEGLDCSPRGDLSGVVRVRDDQTLLLPDRPGNNRTDSLRNIVRDPRVGLLFLLPGSTTTLRVNGHAYVSIEPALLAELAVDGHLPRAVVVLEIDAVYFQCARAIMRAELWNPEHFLDPAALPTAGQMLAGASDCQVGGPEYDLAWPARARQSLW
jgi:PPOX class probable FMN-dependent enzyme